MTWGVWFGLFAELLLKVEDKCTTVVVLLYCSEL